ncbi:MAG: hypothetical protein WA970_16090 [Gammaproteobacteria bacterium]
MIKRPNPGQQSAKATPHGNILTDDDAALVHRYQQISTLRMRENEIHDLRERERNLEVERIAAQVALRALTPGGQPQLAPGKAQEIIRTLDHARALESKLRPAHQHPAAHQGMDADALEQLQAGMQALRTWLEAPRVADLQQTRRAVRAVLFAVTLGAIGAALTVHPAFLLLLLPVGPIVILLRSGQAIAWRRLGAERRFKESGLKGPAEWSEQSVRLRIAELQAATMDLRRHSADREQAPHVADIERPSLAVQLADANQNLADLLREVGIDPDGLNGDLEQWLRLMAEVERSQHDLDDVQHAHRTATSESNEIREQLFGYLARQGTAPANGRANTAALADSLDRLFARRHKGTGPKSA